MEILSAIRYQSPLGPMRISGSSHLISEITFDDGPEQAIINEPANGYPELIIQCVEQLIQYFHGGRRQFELPFLQEGTEFQQRVWHELYGIPYGKTISYLELSRRLGDTKAIRAAAAANGKNKLAVVVPCHRVIGSKNDLVGYAAGLWRKRWLLEHEKKITYGIQTLF